MDALDKLTMLIMSADMKHKAHVLIRECAARPLPLALIKGEPAALLDGLHRRTGDKCRLFVPTKVEDRVVMMSDNSGAYIHSDGIVTPMGSDISQEIGQWVELHANRATA